MLNENRDNKGLVVAEGREAEHGREGGVFEAVGSLRDYVLLTVFLAVVAGCAPSGRFSGFESRVLKSDNNYLVEVTSDFCPMCRVSEDEVDAFEEMEGHKTKGMRVFRVRVEKCDREFRQWLRDHGFYDDVPFYIIVENGKVVGERTGAFFTVKEVEKFVKEKKDLKRW